MASLRPRTLFCRLPLALLLCAALGACMSERPPIGLPSAQSIQFDGVHALGPNCASIALPSTIGDPDMVEHPSIPFGCATYSNLAAQLARPADIVQPTPYGGTNGVVAERALSRYNAMPEPHAAPDAAPATTNVGH
ncbi:CpaD family pilus assembly lipoprotein [Paraburkholderia acidisoli]|uniref:Pilus biogenesis CpaD protein n=1 Tax=Paraburkholderia acidisoli TaxID=2571748 RepID=A0A7Z2JER0_9BURK|nr:CpaD family pilus assembly lipoprotein [Paraburkholderia acidisoli]QGZ60365.1 hypothetical protein FAZ98_00670 [Paraburkholderia acidisoli]